MRYKWLPSWEEVPKHLHESVLLSHLKELEVYTFRRKCLQHQITHFLKHFQMVSALQKVFTYLQKLAAGMEQVVADQADNNGQFLTEFDRAQFGLKMVSSCDHLM